MSKEILLEEDREKIDEILRGLNSYEPIMLKKYEDFDKPKKIGFYVSLIEGFRAYDIKFNEEKYVMFVIFNKEKVDFLDIVSRIRNEEMLGNYKNAMSLQKKLIMHGYSLKYINFVKVGQYYLKMRKFKEAIPYLKVATFLCKKNNVDIDFTELVSSLEQKKFYDDRVVIKEKEFKNGEKDKFSRMKYSIAVSNVMSGGKLEDDSVLSQNDKLIVKLLLAKEYYILGNVKFGDMYLKSVIKEKNKNSEVVELLKDIEANKKLYKMKNKLGK